MHDPGTALLEHALLLAQLVALIVGGTWAVSRIRSTTEVLLTQIRHLDSTIISLTSVVAALQSDHGSVRERLAVLEQQTRDCPALMDYVRGEMPR